MTALVGVAFGSLLTVSMLLVLGLAVTANVQNTFSLLNDKAVLATGALERQVRDHLDLAASAVNGLKTQLDGRPLGPVAFPDLRPVLLAAVHANPAIDVLVISHPGGEEFGVYRSETGKLWPFRRQQVPEVASRYSLPEIGMNAPATWGPLMTSDGSLYANVTVPLVEAGRLSGYLTAAVSTEEIGNTVRQLDDGPFATVFIIANGDEVIAHSDLERLPQIDGKPAVLPARIADLGDVALQRFRTSPRLENFRRANAAGVDVRDMETSDDGPDYLSMTKTIAGYGPGVWTVGQYYEASSISREVQRLFGSAAVGLVSIVIALGLSILLVRRAARPLSEIARRAEYVGSLDFDQVDPLPRSRIRELDQVYQAFNAMVIGLKAMNTYVPRSLFRKLMRLGVDSAAVAQERDLTCIFTDIVGFTSVSEHLTAPETARLLNDHFALLVAAVEAEGGTVDKFVGDGMLAFWGAPDRREDHAMAATRACLAISRSVQAANEKAVEDGREPIRLRIGIHSGRAVVGNVGALDRWNYTVVGDAVNLCERLQTLGRDVAPDAEVVILASDETVSRIGAAGAAPLGAYQLRGRSGPVTVWRIDDTVMPVEPVASASLGLAGE
ncbi:adenylate/guanylate cyclase domain-containing protein [Stappia sp. ES.058]|uniref:adenylate/guanylate cyclase domain-containing protein n=1 Tax=Stappia sp. ES.058 TaxID=1881061 RepID=UPI00087D9796|nr:adenylate/guanylate cyclase domain-containing protein [Stappia sp. ES.058]SDT99465.1 adenylate cyclase [Stappia sp. ES.058]